MASEIATKKRGRSKKIDEVAAVNASGTANVATSKQGSKSRAFSTTDTLSKAVTAKKPTRRKATVSVDEYDEALTFEPETPAKGKTRKTRAKPSVSQPSILEQATAFRGLRDAATLEAKLSSAPKEREFAERTAAKPGTSATPPSQPASDVTPLTTASPQEAQTVADQTASPPAASIPDSASSIAPPATTQPKRSSFMESFLSDAPQPPPVPEDLESSTISDRTAFDAPKVSVDDIVSSEGVTGLSSFPEPRPSNVKTREPFSFATKLPVKTFKAHKVKELPLPAGVARATPTKKSVDPLRYAAGAFSKFKTPSPQPTPEPNAVVDEPVLSSTATPTNANPSQVPSKPTPISNESKSMVDSPLPTQPTEPAAAQASAPEHCITKPTTIAISNRASPPTSSTNDPMLSYRSRPPAPTPPKRPTEMTADELLRNKDFKALRRRWTGVIVGIPFLVVTSYLLYGRLNEMDAINQSDEAMKAMDERRVRGVYRTPKEKRLLDESGGRNGGV